jgi:hypothetical protein
VVSGRRRQGKSFLLESACQQADGFYFSAQEATEAESLSLIGTALTRYLNPVAPITPTDWPTVIEILLGLGRDREVPVAIDEFPYLARVSPALPSMIQAAYAPRRAERSGSRTRLLLCGSALSFMGKLLSGNAPLRGRASLDLTVQTLDYRLAAQFWEFQDPRLAFLVHAVVGGTPAYRTEMIRFDAPGDLADFDAWVARAILSPGSPMFLEARYLLAEEPELRDTALYHSVLAAIAAGNTGRGGIASHVGRKSNELSHPLTVLEDAGLIVRENDAFRANRTDFRINEPLLAFYHAIMRPFWPQLMRGTSADQVWERSQHRFASSVLTRISNVSAGSGRSTPPTTDSATGPLRLLPVPSTTRRTRPCIKSTSPSSATRMAHGPRSWPSAKRSGTSRWGWGTSSACTESATCWREARNSTRPEPGSPASQLPVSPTT